MTGSRTQAGRWLLWAALALVLASTIACSQLLGGSPQIRQKRRFTIVAEPLLLPDSDRPYQLLVQLQTFDIAGAYSQTEIINRTSPYELRRDYLHVWVQRPRDMITQVVATYLREAQLVTRLATENELLDRRPDYVLSGSIGALERFDSGDRWFARLNLAMQLVRQEDGKVVWRGDITNADDEEVFNSDMQYTVQAISEILRHRMESFVRELDGVFERLVEGDEPVPADSLLSGPLPCEPEAAAASVDTGATAGGQAEQPDYYEILPGKLAPEWSDR